MTLLIEKLNFFANGDFIIYNFIITATIRRKSKLTKVPSSQMSFDDSVIDNQNVFEKPTDHSHIITQDQSKTSSSEDVKINEDSLRQEIREKLHLEGHVSSRLQSPNESHFAVTPTGQSKTHSPANGFTSIDCSNLLCQELDQLEKQNVEPDNPHSCKVPDKRKTETDGFKTDVGKVLRLESMIDNLMSPVDENISMFSQLNKEMEEKEVKPVESCSAEVPEEAIELDERLQRKDSKAEVR